ncbi:lipid A deacylase LpxR family protein [uncultured Polaribacter sp.]|uniref:lipid A deacylase LpxR family protein n=1 Tax=uncultured Polaribacter sp. TaxID=174711 RepID=UPI0026058A8D|nr:lipid A deacylase LpxR family protein [uncultured Polaribacter sp.]
MKYIFLLFFFYITSITIAQEKFSKEITLVTDNDLYASVIRDRYYTSGFFLGYRYLTKKKGKNLEKRILEFKLNQEMYTPFRAVVRNVLNHDRPFAGYLYGSFGIKNIYKNHQILNTNIQIGVIGSNSYAEELQGFIHDIYGFEKAVGWKHQIKNAFALNFNAAYLKTILKSKEKRFDLTWHNNLNLGTVYTNISSGLQARIGFIPLQEIMNSIGFNTNLNNEQHKTFNESESFFYAKPMLRYALYDATLQGSFLTPKNSITKELKPVVFDVEVGIKCTLNRFNFGYAFMYNTSKSKDLRYNYGHKYGRITINYVLH